METDIEEIGFEERFCTLNEHLLMSLLHFDVHAPILRTVLEILRPMEIVALSRATFFRIKPSAQQAEIYMKWWREIFWNVDWIRETGDNVTFIGKHITRVHEGLRKWQYIQTGKMKVLVIVLGPYR